MNKGLPINIYLMRYMLFLFLIVLPSAFLFGQHFFIRESDSADHFVLKSIDNEKVTRYIGSYDILRGQPVKFMTNWSLSKDGKFYWVNGENIYEFDFDSQKSRLISSHWHFILEFFVIDSFAYIVYNPLTNEGPHDNRYSPGLKFCYLNLKNGQRNYFQIPGTYNFTNLSISPNRTWAAFINTIPTDNDNVKKYQFVLFNQRTRSLRIIDSAVSSKYEWFGDDDKYNSSIWADSSTLLYYKHTNGRDYGSVLSYSTLTKEAKVKLKSIAERDFTWFGFYQNAFYFSDRKGIYRIENSNDKRVIVRNSNVLQACIFPRD